MSSGRERLYSWDDRSMRWYINAVGYRSFHSDVAEMVLNELPENPRICDIGCGIGALTMHLAPKCSNVLALDLNAKPLKYLAGELERKHITNVDVLNGDFEKIAPPDTKYDGAVFCLAGGIKSFLKLGEKWSNRLFFIENATDRRSFSSVGKRGKEVYYNEDLEYIKSSGLKFKHTFFTAPFGQVFTDRADAIAFMKHYDKGENDEDINTFLNEHIKSLSHPDYSLYLPNEKPLIMLEVEL